MTTQVEALRAQLEGAIECLERSVVALSDRRLGVTKRHVEQAQAILSVATFAEATRELIAGPGLADADVLYPSINDPVVTGGR